MTNEELVKSLRLCQFGECGCGKCYYKELKGDWCTEDNHPEFFDCDDKLKLDAAAAIEELEAEVKELKRVNLEIFEDLPKRGEWITFIHNPLDRMNNPVYECGCSECHNEYVFPEIPNYCPNCGAKMEVQDGSSR